MPISLPSRLLSKCTDREYAEVMAQYKVVSDLVSVAPQGKLVTEADFPEGTNFDALVEAGHLVPAKPEKALPKDDK